LKKGAEEAQHDCVSPSRAHVPHGIGNCTSRSSRAQPESAQDDGGIAAKRASTRIFIP